MSDHQLLALLVEAQRKVPGRPFIELSTAQGPAFLLGLGEQYPLHIIRPALASLRSQGFIEDYSNRSFIVSPAGIAYYEQLQS